MLDSIPIPTILNHRMVYSEKPMLLVDCVINPRYLKCFGFDVNIDKIYDEFCIVHKLLIKYIPRNTKEKRAEITNIYLVDAHHPNAKLINKFDHFSTETLTMITNELEYTYKGKQFELYEFCKNPYKSYAQDPINISLNKLINDLSYWDFDEGYWFDLSKVSVDFGDVDMLYDQKNDIMIPRKKVKKRFNMGYMLNNFKKPLSSIMNVPERDFIYGMMNVAKQLRMV